MRKSLFILPCLILLFACGEKASIPEIEVQTGLNDSIQLRSVGVNTRISELATLAEKEPEDPALRLELAKLQEAKRNLFAAAEEARETLKIKPNSAEAHVIIGRAAFDSERFAEARENFISALSLNPGLAEAHAGLADCLMVDKKYSDAEAEYSEALSLNPELDSARFNRAAARARLKKWTPAEEDYLHILSRDKTHVPAWLFLGIVYEKTGRPAPAVQAWETALQLDPSRTEVRNWIEEVRKRI